MNENPLCGAVAVLGRPNAANPHSSTQSFKPRSLLFRPALKPPAALWPGFTRMMIPRSFFMTRRVSTNQEQLSHFMLHQVEEVLKGADGAMFLIDVREGLTEEDYLVAEWLKKFHGPFGWCSTRSMGFWTISSKWSRTRSLKSAELESSAHGGHFGPGRERDRGRDQKNIASSAPAFSRGRFDG